MIELKGVIPLLFLSICVFSNPAWGWQMHAPPPTSSECADDCRTECARCHTLSPFQAELVITDPVNAACLSVECHGDAFSGSNDHPDLLAVKEGDLFTYMPIPSLFWLDDHVDEAGKSAPRLNCATCHDPHPTTVERRPALLRGDATDAAFCASCHNDDDPGWAPHKTGVIHAHTRPWTEDAVGENGTLDTISAGCTASCHRQDDPHSSFCLLAQKGGCLGHFVGLIYRESTEKNPQLAPSESLPSSIFLNEGKVGCLSCHDIYSKEKDLLTVSNEGSALCLSCHRI